MESRLEKIEAKLALAEDQLDEMNKALYRQQQHIERLQQEVVALREQLRQSLPAESRNAADEIPPHY